MKDVVFLKLCVTQKGFLIGTTNGYLLNYDFKNDFSPKFQSALHISNNIKALASMSQSRYRISGEEYMIAIAGVYQKKIGKKK